MRPALRQHPGLPEDDERSRLPLVRLLPTPSETAERRPVGLEGAPVGHEDDLHGLRLADAPGPA